MLSTLFRKKQPLRGCPKNRWSQNLENLFVLVKDELNFLKNLHDEGLRLFDHFHNVLRLLMFYQIFLSSQVKRCAIITYKHGIYELPKRLKTCAFSPPPLPPRKGNIRKVLKPHRMIAQRPAPRQNEYFANASKKTIKSRN